MKFLTPAFVRVENPQERKELVEWLDGIGYELDANSADINDARINTVAVSMIDWGFCHGNMYWLQYWVDVNSESYASHIDCGTNILLFKALAAMNEDLVRPQWIYDHIRSELCYNHGGYPTRRYRMPTVEEIIEHLRQKNEI